MDVWIETAAGSLVMAPSMTHIAMREAGAGQWEVSVSASAAPAPFATGLKDKAAARSIRNALALRLHDAKQAASPQVIAYDQDSATVDCFDLAA